MISADCFLDAARAAGISLFAGVPCSFLTPIINRAIARTDITYIAATSESEAVAMSAGAWLAGRGAGVLMQNSGLGDAMNPITSLNFPFGIPCLLVISARGEPGIRDEAQHTIMGRVLPDLLEKIGVVHRNLPDSPERAKAALLEAWAVMSSTRQPCGLILRKGILYKESNESSYAASTESCGPARQQHHDFRRGRNIPTRIDALQAIVSRTPDEAAIIATTGMTGRELFAVGDKPQNLYMVGSMGCASALGLGVAVSTTRPVVVLDGDGAALMRLGNMATVGAIAPARFLHVILDNHVYDSTGGQPTVASGVNFGDVAVACGYAQAWSCDTVADLCDVLEQGFATAGPHLIHVSIRPGSVPYIGRPSLEPHEVADRFARFLAGDLP